LVSAVELGYSPHGILDGGHKGDMETRSDLFCGTWELDPATLDYQYGRPGRRAIYTIEKSHEGLQFVLDADDADGKHLHVTYGGWTTLNSLSRLGLFISPGWPALSVLSYERVGPFSRSGVLLGLPNFQFRIPNFVFRVSYFQFRLAKPSFEPALPIRITMKYT
jgi:hypothetical protein